MRAFYRYRARKQLRQNDVLWGEITCYMKKTKSTGVSWVDFWELYSAIRSQKPKHVLECGPGASTIIIAYALMENEKEGFPGRISAMEELEDYLNYSIELLPEYLKKYVQYVKSPRVDSFYEIYRGVRYRDVPKVAFDFVFVDGPHHHSPTDDHFCFDFDFLEVVRNSDSPVSGIVDCRLSSSYVLQKLLGEEKVRFDYVKELAFIKPVTKNDLKSLSLESNMQMLHSRGKLFRNTKLELYL